MKKKRIEWTPEKCDELRRMYNTCDVNEIAVYFGCSASAVRGKVRKTGLGKKCSRIRSTTTAANVETAKLINSDRVNYMRIIRSRYRLSVLDAENCFQDALLKILCMEPYSDRISKPATWFYTVLKNTVIDYISLKRIYMEDIDGLSSDIFTDETNAGDSYSYWKSLFNTVSKKTLNKTEQTIFKFLMQGWAYEDIAAELGRTEGYIKTAVRRAKQKIGDFIKNPANSPYLINIA